MHFWRSRRRPDPVLYALFDEAGRNALQASVLLRDIVADVPDQNGLSEEMVRCEHEGDRITHEIYQRLAEHSSERVGQDWADIRALASALDDVVDFAEEAADQLDKYGVEASMEVAQQITDVLVACSEEVVHALRCIGSQGNIAPRLVEIHRLENEADRLQRIGVAALFRTGIDPMVVIRWKDIFETLEASVDACETVANVLEGMTMREQVMLRRAAPRPSAADA